MKYIHAKKLHNGDEIILKETNELCVVQNTEVHEKKVIIWAMTPKYGFCGLQHTDYK